ncbi:MAG TPA: ABC transporter ATP-binding protein [Myxococcota bacterium]|nr:ABC transporter ATP-binding protein [Myxococcota bacterium]
MVEPVLEVSNLSKKFYQQKKTITALKNINLSLREGEVFGLLGTNGAGKTTLSSILATLHPPTEGEVKYCGTSIYDDLDNYRRAVGFCPQRPNLNNYLNLRDNLYFAGLFYGLSSDEAKDQVNLLADELELHEYLDHVPQSLSGGWRQRFMLARSIVHSPKILILDEPTVALDPQVRHRLWEKIRGLKAKGLTIILTTHYLEEAEVLADRVCILHRGAIKLIDKPANLKNDFKLKTLEEVFLQLTEEEVAI